MNVEESFVSIRHIMVLFSLVSVLTRLDRQPYNSHTDITDVQTLVFTYCRNYRRRKAHLKVRWLIYKIGNTSCVCIGEIQMMMHCRMHSKARSFNIVLFYLDARSWNKSYLLWPTWRSKDTLT